ncbi:MAG TPA: cytochrome c3 family protein [Candidatus Deferrimicrobium sp.]|nr:cytochrome c3 family protein [Candidatus Deferrimicrobium sp.]
MRLRRHIVSVALAFLIARPEFALGHVENVKLPEGCGSCHVGHGMANQPMLAQAEEKFCYQCHGSDGERAVMREAGKISELAKLSDIQREFAKQYRHPVEEFSGQPEERPVFGASTASARRAECVDCHNPHERIQPGPKLTYEVSGFTLAGQYVEKSLAEYQICLKCHFEIAGIDRSDREFGRSFSVSAVSQHPITRPASGKRSPSLTSSASTNQMKCSDCHTNDDFSGPRGPHGSNYRFMLSGNYDIDKFAQESPFAFQFCYSCHDRMSLLSNESFRYHREHVLGDPAKGVRGTSCYSCHSSHSSADNPHLIRFNPEAVSRDRSGRLLYLQAGQNSGECYLTCHGHEHSPGRY